MDLTEDGALRSLFDRRMRVASRRDLEGLLTRDTKIGQSRVEFKGGLRERTVRAEVCPGDGRGQEAFESRCRRIMPPAT